MYRKRLIKAAALLCIMTLLGCGACQAEPVKNNRTEQNETENRKGTGDSEGQTEDSKQENGTQDEKTGIADKGSTSETALLPEVREWIDAVTQEQITVPEERSAVIHLNDEDTEITGTGCEMDGDRLKIKKAGVYEISGTLSKGSIYVNVDNESEVHLILNGVTVHNETSAALYCKKAKKVTITLADGSVNRFSDGASYVFEEGEDEPDSAIYAKHDLVINGTGKLLVTSVYGDALKGKDCLYILGGTLEVKAADDGIVGRDLLYIGGGTFTVDAAADALKANNDTDASLGNVVIDGGSFVLTSEEDGIQAENTLIVNGGDFKIKTGGGAANATVKKEDFGFGGMGRGDWGNWGQAAGTQEDTSVSSKGLKAGVLLAVNGGCFELDNCDDALHGNGDVTITGGEFTVSTGDDGVHAEEKLLIEGTPVIRITKCYEGFEGLEIIVNGGDIRITASDDGLNAAGGSGSSGGGRPGMGMFGGGEGEITVNGGRILVEAEGDGLDSNGTLTINGGTVFVFGPTGGGNGVLDYDGTFLLNGGSLLAAGSSDMTQTPANTSGQYSLAAELTSRAKAGSKLEIVVDGKTVFSETVPKQFSYIVASSGEFKKGSEVSVAVNGESCYDGALTDVVTCFGFSGGMGGFGGNGNPGGGRGNKDDFGNGRIPQMPNGAGGNPFGGEMPQMPNGTWPDFSDGAWPQMPEGGMSWGTDV